MKTDQEIQADVQAELRTDPSVDASQIGVAVKDGVVTLTGTIPSFAERWSAERAAKRVYGVEAVADELEVRLPHTSQRTDAEIARVALDALKWHSGVPDDGIQLTIDKGWVRLEGTVQWPFQKHAAENVIRNITGVTGVTNLIEVAPTRVKPADVRKEIRLAFERNADLDSRRIGVDAKDGTVTLHGNVRSWFEREEAARAASNIAGVREVQNELAIVP